MRPAEAILSDIYKSVSKYGDTDQLSFFKDIAGEEAAKSFQALVRSAGSGELQKLLTDLRGSQGEAQKAAKVMADNLSGDLKNLDSAWEGFRIQVEETTDGPLRKLTQGLSDLITSASEWVKENPRLTQTLILVGGALTVFAGAIGIASIAASFILGPLAKLRLILSMIGISSITATGGISTLGMAFSGLRVILASLLTIPGAILAAFVIAGVLIWKYWEPIKAFFSGFFSGIWQALTPLRSAFAPLIPVFSAIGDGIKSVWEWFKNLLSPMETSKETLDKCASAGETFGRVMGTALSILLWPLQQLMNGVSWLLEKLDLIPEGIDRARQQADKAQQDLEASATALAGHQLPLGQATVSGTSGGGKPPKLTGDNGTLRRLNNIVDNTKATADNTKEARKKIGPGDITFKNLPRALALRGAYQEARISPQAIPRVAAPAAGGILSVPSAKQGPLSAPVSAPTNGAPVFNLIFNEVGQHSARDLERMVRNAVRDAMASTTRSNRGSFRDRD